MTIIFKDILSLWHLTSSQMQSCHVLLQQRNVIASWVIEGQKREHVQIFLPAADFWRTYQETLEWVNKKKQRHNFPAFHFVPLVYTSELSAGGLVTQQYNVQCNSPMFESFLPMKRYLGITVLCKSLEPFLISLYFASNEPDFFLHF